MSLIRADARHLPLADASVDCVVTSPPYWGLRDYGSPLQIGLEKTPYAFVDAMVEVFRDVRRVLISVRPHEIQTRPFPCGKRDRMTPIRKIAEEIADDLFTNGFGNVAQRLVLTIDTPVPRDLGGLSRSVAVDRIEQKLRAVKPGRLL